MANSDQEMKTDDGGSAEIDSKSMKEPERELESGGWKKNAQKREDEEYDMCRSPRGKAIIFNHYKYDDPKISVRFGTDKDKERMERVLTALGFQTKVHNDKTFSEIQEILQEVSKEDHAKHDCLIVVVMSHGGMLEVKSKDKKMKKLIEFLEEDPQFKKEQLWKAGISREELLEIKNMEDKDEKVGKVTQILARDKLYDEEELWKPFLEGEGKRNETLLGKPKLIFIQACRIVHGKKDRSTGFVVASRAQKEPTESTGIKEKFDFYSIPDVADLLIARCTFEECSAYRDTNNGSWFIQTLCEELEKDMEKKDGEKDDLLRLLTRVNRKVALNYPEYDATDTKNRIAECKQMPNFYSTLLRLVYFKNLTKPI